MRIGKVNLKGCQHVRNTYKFNKKAKALHNVPVPVCKKR